MMDKFDVTDVEAELRTHAWLERQCRTLLDHRKRAFELGYRTGVESRDE